ncbi:lytic transglycosylase domain-containing protein [Xylophilus sp. GW821-FHT01B05]
MQHSTWADVWGFVDEAGTAHFAAEQVDPRYQLFFRAGDSYDTRDLAAAPVEAASGALEKLQTFFDISPSYKSVRRYLRAAAEEHDIDLALLQALIVTESGFNAQAVSPRGAVGLMQVMPATAQRYGVAPRPQAPVARQLADPSVNIGAGARYLRYLLDLFPGQTELALAAYNAGEGAVQRAGNRIPNFRETQNYVKTVMQIYRALQPVPLRATGGPPQRVRMELPGLAPEAAQRSVPPSRLQARASSDDLPLRNGDLSP